MFIDLVNLVQVTYILGKHLFDISICLGVSGTDMSAILFKCLIMTLISLTVEK